MLSKKLLTVSAEALAMISGFLITAVPVWAVSTYKVLHSFTGKDGAYPMAGLISDAAGNLYGTTVGNFCQQQSCGTVFELSPSANGKWTRTVLHYFNEKNGCQPYAGLIFDAHGNLYGTTICGGASGGGTVFELSPNANGKWTETVLHSFGTSYHLGYSPYAGLIFDAAGNLYGTTFAGGASGGGTVFELSSGANDKWTAATLHAFGKGNDGTAPRGSLISDVAGNLYGTTFAGGLGDSGIIFELSQSFNGWKETVIYNFCSLQNCADGSQPYAGLVPDGAGNLYGTTSAGGASGFGTVFKVATGVPNSQWTETVLHDFNLSDGAFPFAGLVFDAAGSLYGTTNKGGNLNCTGGNGCGTVFQLTPSNGQWTETVLHAFLNKTGRDPSAGLIFDGAGNLYGTAFDGAASGVGNVFEITP